MFVFDFRFFCNGIHRGGAFLPYFYAFEKCASPLEPSLSAEPTLGNERGTVNGISLREIFPLAALRLNLAE